ncbi:MAG: gliding motility-associated C-terminal domain-containing protein [Bacteroidetes bacterium]|nr:gliding motility-associated C-terminal domain-containing protein [Bacteroidota bacterium]
MSLQPRYLLLTLWLFATVLLHAQNFIITNGADNTCSGKFFDSGGASGAGYSSNESKTYTLCPNGGAAVKINFNGFNLDNKDTLTVYDGNSVAASVLGKYTKDDLLGLTLTASTTNTSGCLTFLFKSDNAVNGFWEGSITCGNKCLFPIADITSANKIVKLCPGDNLSLDGSASIPGAGSITKYEWFTKKDTITGPSYNATFSSPAGLNVELRVSNSSGCSNINKEQVQVWVSTPPVFTGTTGDLKGCAGKQVCFSGNVAGINFKESVPKYNGGDLALPDKPGTCFSSSLNFKTFTPGQKMTSVTDLQSICVDMEHSYLDDLTIKLTCPNGQSVKLFNRGGAGKYLGTPVINDDPAVKGTCGNYCWTATSIMGELQNAVTVNKIVPQGNYKSVQPFTNLIGCPLNGEWSFEVCDMQVNDNGFVCTWDLTFNPAIAPPGITFTPVFNMTAGDSTAWISDTSIVDSSANGDTICAIPFTIGNKSYTFRAMNDFGCAYDTTLTVKIYPYPSTDLPDTLQICSSLLQSQLQVKMNSSPEGTYQYQWKPGIGLSDSTILNPLLKVSNAANSYVFQTQDNASPGCIAYDTTIIKKIAIPPADFTLDTDSGCVPLTVKLRDVTVPKPNTFHWIFGDGTEVNSPVDSAIHTYSTFGITNIEYVIKTFDGCADTIRKKINATPQPVVLFHIAPPEAYIENPFFCFQNATQKGGNVWTWRFGTEAISNNESDCFTFSDSVKCHKITLISTNAFGCTDSLEKAVCVKNFRQKIYAPNSFTPNSDKDNDEFMIFTDGISDEDYSFSIFNRWGNLIYESKIPNSSWDGNIKGIPAPPDVYVYKLQYKDEWGSNQHRVGSITLIR